MDLLINTKTSKQEEWKNEKEGFLLFFDPDAGPGHGSNGRPGGKG
jgi:hypothetical protein